jgi:hypothetical protein
LHSEATAAVDSPSASPHWPLRDRTRFWVTLADRDGGDAKIEGREGRRKC